MVVVVGFPLFSCVVAVVARYRNCAMFSVVVPMVMVLGSVLVVSICVLMFCAAVSICCMVSVVVVGSFMGMLVLVHCFTVIVVGSVPLFA